MVDQANPDTLAMGGVAEFDAIADATVALQGSGTADAPFLLLHLDCGGRSNVLVSVDAFAQSGVPGQFEFNSMTQSGSLYQVEVSTNLSAWTGVGETVPGDGTVRTFAVQTNEPTAFWRLRMDY
ncbi:MAG: hypothetical protein JXR37_13235 [Kiritimatiellae bacterium]|nr:hypothetical protein [Kiritimatiellia bacterium]